MPPLVAFNAVREVENWMDQEGYNYLGEVALYVDSIDEAIDFYTTTLNFKVLEDNSDPSERKANGRQVTIQQDPIHALMVTITVVQTDNDELLGTMTSDSASTPFEMFMLTHDIAADYRQLRDEDIVVFVDPVSPTAPLRKHAGRKVAAFRDLFDTKWNMVSFPGMSVPILFIALEKKP